MGRGVFLDTFCFGRELSNWALFVALTKTYEDEGTGLTACQIWEVCRTMYLDMYPEAVRSKLLVLCKYNT